MSMNKKRFYKIETPIKIEDMQKHCETSMYFKSNGRFGKVL